MMKSTTEKTSCVKSLSLTRLFLSLFLSLINNVNFACMCVCISRNIVILSESETKEVWLFDVHCGGGGGALIAIRTVYVAIFF